MNGASIYFRGNKILKEIFQYLLNNQLKEATNVILTGCSGKYSYTGIIIIMLYDTLQLVAWLLIYMLIM